MKTVVKIDPELEYENAKKIIDLVSKQMLDSDQISSLDSSVANLATVARVLLEREARRRGPPKPNPKNKTPKNKNNKERENSSKLPSVKYPDIELREEIVRPAVVPTCPCCSSEMKESGLFDLTEKLEVEPKKYYIQRSKRVKFNCSKCYGAMINTPSTPSIVQTSNYGDSLIIDVALSKYCDLIPVERYAQMAVQSGLMGELPPHSLIGLTHHLANFLRGVYEKLINEVLLSKVLHADETPHKMLEGDETYHWYLWGFFSTKGCYFEAHGTRSGDVAFKNLEKSAAEFLLTDGYAGYGKAVKDLEKKTGKKIKEVHCNSHAYRYFKDASTTWKSECEIFLSLYGQIYKLEDECKLASIEDQLEYRNKMLPLFEEIKTTCERDLKQAMSNSFYQKAMNYFLNHYEGLTICTQYIDVPLDNNLAEREFRSPVVGRKTWIGTHSKRGAETTAILFSIVRSCMMNKVNPRNYFPWIVNQIHVGKEILTPYEYLQTLG